MFEDPHYTKYLFDKLKFIILSMVAYLAEEEHSEEEVQEKFDQMTIEINSLQEEFYENDSELDSVARECIAADIRHIIEHFDLDMTVEDALREHDL
jgi:hypothetical protein